MKVVKVRVLCLGSGLLFPVRPFSSQVGQESRLSWEWPPFPESPIQQSSWTGEQAHTMSRRCTSKSESPPAPLALLPAELKSRLPPCVHRVKDKGNFIQSRARTGPLPPSPQGHPPHTHRDSHAAGPPALPSPTASAPVTLHSIALFISFSGLLTPLFWPTLVACHPGGSEGKVSARNAGQPGSIPGLGRSPGEGNGNPLQYPCLENPMDGGAW